MSRLLKNDELRVAALRAFDGREVDLTTHATTAEGIITRLCHYGPTGQGEQLRRVTWVDEIAKMLKDIGWESDKIPQGKEEKVKLKRIFK